MNEVRKRSPLAVILLAVGLALVVVFSITRGQNKSAGSQPGADVQNVTPRTSAPVKSVDLTIEKPINDVSPVSGKPIRPGITSKHKGYAIGHCCEVDMQKWEAWSSTEKDAFISRYKK